MAKTSTGVPGWLSETVPDIAWWEEQITAGARHRDTKLYKPKWDKWNKMYSGEFSPQITPMPVNLMFMMVRSLVPRLYFRNPSISITPAKPGPKQLGLSKLIERIDNGLIKTMNMKEEMKRMAERAFFNGSSVAKLGYGSEFFLPKTMTDENHSKKPWASVDFRMNISNDRPWFNQFPVDHYVLPATARTRAEAPWCVHVVYREVADLNNDKRFSTGKLHGSHNALGDSTSSPDTAKVFEVHCYRTGKIFMFSPDTQGGESGLVLKPQDDGLQTMRGGPFYSLTFNGGFDSPWGLPDAQILEPFQHELNALMTSIIYHARITARKLMAQTGSMTAAEASAIVNSQIGAVIFAEDPNALTPLNLGGVPQELILLIDKYMQLVQYTLGFSRNQFGEYRGGSESPSATEAQIVRQASEIRIDERRDLMADLLVDVMQDTNLLIAKYWNDDMVEQVAGPYGVPIWVEFNGDMISNAEYELKIDPDSSVPETKASREQKATQLFQMLYPLTQQPDAMTGRPSIDSNRLTRYLLHELHGTEYDDMLLGQPNLYTEDFQRKILGGENGLTTPVSPEQFGSMMQNSPTLPQL